MTTHGGRHVGGARTLTQAWAARLRVTLLLAMGLFVATTAPDAARIPSSAVVVSQAAIGYAPSLVRTSGRQLLVRKRQANGTLAVEVPYVIRGVFWSPASPSTNTSPSDRNNAHVRRQEFGQWFETDIPLMAAMNVNTVRIPIDPGFDPVLGPIGLAVLDELYRHGIMVIMTVDDAINSAARIVSAVNFYKDHPAILMWSIGSEWNINRYFGAYPTVQAAAVATEASASLIKRLDRNHPVATSYGDMDPNLPGFVNTTIPSVDLWSLNVYRGNTFDNASGSVFGQWTAISNKPMFIGEFGVDAFHGRCLSNPPTGSVNAAEQVAWTIDLWNDIARNLSAVDHTLAALGGTVFEWNDEWWKVPPPGSQQTGGWTSDGFPDWHGTEEYFGVVDINRVPRPFYLALAAAFHPSYEPPPHTTTFRAISRGANLCGSQANFRQDGWTFYQRFGGGSGGRGFNIAVANASTGAIIEAGRNFDTWGGGDAAKTALSSYIESIPSGRLVMLAVADEAGLNPGPTSACTMRTSPATVTLLQTLEALGSTLIRNYCWRGSWAMVAVKGTGVRLAEDYLRTEEARAEAPVPTPEPPTAAVDTYTTAHGTILNVTAPGVLANDNAKGAGAMSVALVSPTSNGVLSLAGDGGFTYRPNAGFSGVDHFTYRASNIAGTSPVAHSSLTVAPPGPAPPMNLRVLWMSGNTVTFGWSPPTSEPSLTGFQIEGGVMPGQVLGVLALDVTPAVTVTLPTASWYVRVRTNVSGVLGAASNEVLAHVNQNLVPSPPTNLLGLVNGDAVHLAWKNTIEGEAFWGAPATSVMLKVTGPVNVSLPLGLTETFSYAGVPPGTYTFTVQSQNGTGLSLPSSPVTLTFPQACTSAPHAVENPVAYTMGGIVFLYWDPPASGPAPTAYVLYVTGSFVGSFATSVRSFRSPAPPGTYYLSIVSTNPCGASVPTAVQSVTLP
ncbi:MAG TPA: interleukin-like EMT inducer domain-containing protein [Vicinamibacterales bacterium]|nr:interleukin-like EMT inducer domain-containing protein [Vicinamibacterales bacterium]